MKYKFLAGWLIILSLIYIAFPSQSWSTQEKSHGSAGLRELKPSQSTPTPTPTQDRTTEKIEEPSVTHHDLTIRGQTLKYTATAGYLQTKDKADKPKALIFFVAYQKEPLDDKMDNKIDDRMDDRKKRPITFAFNGGPGASSVFLHLGALGPKRILWKEEGRNPDPPNQVIPNDYTWLEFTDLVFIDPLDTGFSRPVPEVEAKEFFNPQQDAELIGDFIRLYISRYGRWSSPKFLAGESYGATRAVALLGYLQDSLDLNLNGLILISPALDFQTIMYREGNDLPYILSLPSYTASAWYHQRLPAELMANPLPKTLEEVEAWATDEYSLALLKGDTLSDLERTKIREKLSYYTGLPSTLVDFDNLRLDNAGFTKGLLRKEHQLIGVLDSQFSAFDPEPTDEYPEFDPALFLVSGPLSAAMNTYVSDELNYVSDLPYEVLNEKVNRAWDWGVGIHRKQGYLNVSKTLRQAMSKNKYLKVYVACGYYDLATPYFATLYTINHLSLDPSLRGNITISKFPVGHQIYVHIPSLEKLTAEVADFLKKALLP